MPACKLPPNTSPAWVDLPQPLVFPMNPFPISSPRCSQTLNCPSPRLQLDFAPLTSVLERLQSPTAHRFSRVISLPKGSEVAQASFALGKPLPAAPRHLLVLRVAGNGSQIFSVTFPGPEVGWPTKLYSSRDASACALLLCACFLCLSSGSHSLIIWAAHCSKGWVPCLKLTETSQSYSCGGVGWLQRGCQGKLRTTQRIWP